jgi:hypothetical protein
MTNIGYLNPNREAILNAFPIIAPIEHKRWCAEKMVNNYRYGILPKDKNTKNAVKDVMKIHDQLVRYEQLNEAEKEKDLNIFLLMPLLLSLEADQKN